MDKYSQYALSTIRYKVFKDSVSQSNLISEESSLLEVIAIKQDYNYTIDQYYIALIGSTVASITFDKKTFDNQETNPEVDSSQPCMIIPVVYSKKIDSLVIELQGGILDPILISLQYTDTDKKVFDAEQQEAINQKIRLDINKGLDLINIYWDDVSKDVDHVVISLFHEDRLICSSVEKGINFKSISGLAFAQYKCEVIEYDNADQILATQSSVFELSNPFNALGAELRDVRKQVAASGQVYYGR